MRRRPCCLTARSAPRLAAGRTVRAEGARTRPQALKPPFTPRPSRLPLAAQGACNVIPRRSGNVRQTLCQHVERRCGLLHRLLRPRQASWPARRADPENRLSLGAWRKARPSYSTTPDMGRRRARKSPMASSRIRGQMCTAIARILVQRQRMGRVRAKTGGGVGPSSSAADPLDASIRMGPLFQRRPASPATSVTPPRARQAGENHLDGAHPRPATPRGNVGHPALYAVGKTATTASSKRRLFSRPSRILGALHHRRRGRSSPPTPPATGLAASVHSPQNSPGRATPRLPAPLKIRDRLASTAITVCLPRPKPGLPRERSRAPARAGRPPPTLWGNQTHLRRIRPPATGRAGRLHKKSGQSSPRGAKGLGAAFGAGFGGMRRAASQPFDFRAGGHATTGRPRR